MEIINEFINELSKDFSGDLKFDSASKVLYSTDASIYQIEPLGAVLPRSHDDLIAAISVAAKYKLPILARGSGTSLAGQAIGRAVIVDCSRYLDKIPVQIDVEGRTAVVEPGVILGSLNKLAAQHGLMFGPDPASAERATIGGVIGNNATGAHSILYGMTADHLLKADVVLSDGSLATWGPVGSVSATNNPTQQKILDAIYKIRTDYLEDIKENWPKTWRNSAGYRLNYLLPWSASQPDRWSGNSYPPGQDLHSEFNLAALLAGSEGTLAVIRSATLGLVPKPKHTILAVISFNSIVEACEHVPYLLKLSPSAVELIPQMLIRLAKGVPAYSSMLGFVEGDPAALLAVEFSGDNPDQLRTLAKSVAANAVIAESQLDQARIWAVRKVGLGIFDSLPTASRPIAFIEDCAIPVDRLGEFVREIEYILGKYATTAAIYAHASAGCLHIRPVLDLKSMSGVRNLREISFEVLKLTLKLGGAMSSEHGDGLVRAEWLRETYGDRVLEAMKQIKQAADPNNLLNPEKMLDAPGLDTNLRYGASYKSDAWTPKLDFWRAGGLSTAIEHCNGQGVCRKHDGVMCPSFQATRDEKNSTRGRANLLRNMITSSDAKLNEKAVKEAMDLCLACKGCKAECPSSVDMARLKYEYQSHYYESHRRPIRDYIFAYIGIFAKLGSPVGVLVNWVMETTIAKGIGKKLFGITDKRRLPKFRKLKFAKIRLQIKNKYAFQKNVIESEKCILLRDTFTHYFEPETEASAKAVLSACEVECLELSFLGAGRTLLSKGFVDAAKRHANLLLNEINHLDPHGMLPIIGIEPSEIYMLRDDFLDLLPGRKEEVEKLAARAWLVDEFLIRPAQGQQNSRITKALSLISTENNNSKICLHGHCYQKAQAPHRDGYPVGVGASVAMLSGVGYEVETLNTGCCGMAGAFGYEQDHVEISMKVGELKLFPAIRERSAQADLSFVATGTSCRSQISDGTGIVPRHSIVLVADRLGVGC